MKVTFLIAFLFPIVFPAQEKKIAADFDGDKIPDTAYIDVENLGIAYELSSQKFKKIFSEFEDSGEIYLHPAKNGFKVNINQMRAGSSYQFRYEKETGKMRLIGMSRYEFGPANNDGSGESSVNLLTNSYIAEWNYFDNNKAELIKIPTIKKKMVLPKVYFDNLKNAYSIYVEKDVQYYLSEKKRLYKNEN